MCVSALVRACMYVGAYISMYLCVYICVNLYGIRSDVYRLPANKSNVTELPASISDVARRAVGEVMRSPTSSNTSAS